MPLQQCIIEVRKNLYCANVFLQFTEPITNRDLKLWIVNNTLHVQELEAEAIEVPFGFSAEANTLPNLLVDGCNVSFRLSSVKLKEDKIWDIPVTATGRINPTLERDVCNVISCANCKCHITESHAYNRILEFPSDDINLADFFCHYQSLDDNATILVPKLTDVFYGYGFIVLNRKNIIHSKEEECQVYCQQCLNYLGVTLFSGNAVKLWTDTLCYTKYSKDILHDEPFPKTTPQELLLNIIKETLVDFTFKLQQIQFSKILIESTFSDRKSKFLFLHLLEKEVPVFCNSIINSKSGNKSFLAVHTNRCKSIKLYYRCIDENNEGSTLNDTEELDTWKNDMTIHNVKISPTLFCIMLKELADNSLILPVIYRNCGKKFLSFIFY